MKKLISLRHAALGLLVILTLMLGFHLLILLGVIPYEIVWGGRMKTPEQMHKFELVSVVLNAVMLLVVSCKAGWLKIPLPAGIIKAALWMMFGLFLMNTVGNLASTNNVEKLVFTPLTLLLELLTLRLALDTEEKAA